MLDSYNELTKTLEVPAEFKRLALFHTVSACVGRQIRWTTTYGDTYCNPYSIMVGGPGTGKSKAVSSIVPLIRDLASKKTIHLSATNLTKASMIDQLKAAGRLFPGWDGGYCHLNILSSELGTLTDAYSPALLSTLSTLYDNDDVFVEDKRGIKAEDKALITNPTVSLLTGTQPRYMTEHIPMTAWEQGFATRLWIEYIEGSYVRKQSLFATTEINYDLIAEIIRELERLSTMIGYVKFSPAAQKFMDNFYLYEDRATAPTHSLLSGSNERRALKLQKYAVLLSLCLRDTFIIEVEDLEQTLEWLLSSEVRLVRMLEDIGTSADSEVIRAIFEFVKRRWEDNQTPVSHAQLKVFVNGRGDIHKVPKYISELKDMQALKVGHGKIGNAVDKTREVYYPVTGFTWK